MRRLACVLAGISIAAVAAGPALAGSASTKLSVTVTVVAPGTLGGTGPRSGGTETAPAAPERDAPGDSASPAK